LRRRTARRSGTIHPDGYQLHLTCGCGVEFKRWVTAEDADEDLLRSALLAFEN
jgi:hypothetical protein